MPAEVLVVDKLPDLGGGKIDLMGVQAMVREHAAARDAAEPAREAATA